MMNTGTRCKHCGETYGMHGVGDECPTVYAHFEQEDEKLFTASDIALAEERGRREVWAYVQSISALLPAGEEFWSEKRDVYIIDATKFHALLAEEEADE